MILWGFFADVSNLDPRSGGKDLKSSQEYPAPFGVQVATHHLEFMRGDPCQISISTQLLEFGAGTIRVINVYVYIHIGTQILKKNDLIERIHIYIYIVFIKVKYIYIYM